MTQQQRSKELRPVREHWENGGLIQLSTDEGKSWQDYCGNDDNVPAFQSICYIWRIKPSPRLVLLEAEDWLKGGPWWIRGANEEGGAALVTLVYPEHLMTSLNREHRYDTMMQLGILRRSAVDPEGRWLQCAKEAKE